MKGLLQVPDSKFWSSRFISAFIAELIGTMLFVFIASSAYQSQFVAWVNGLTVAVIVYITANVSGGHLNPAITWATMLTGHISFLKGISYWIAQFSGACLANLLLAGLLPNVSLGMGNGGPGCYHYTGITGAQAFGWELVLTFVLVSAVYAVAVGEPNFGHLGPWVVGVAVWIAVLAGGPFTGGAVNPVRPLSPGFVFHCYLRESWYYVLGEFTGATLAALSAWPLYGTGGIWHKQLQRLLPQSAHPYLERIGTMTGTVTDKVGKGSDEADSRTRSEEMLNGRMNPHPKIEQSAAPQGFQWALGGKARARDVQPKPVNPDTRAVYPDARTAYPDTRAAHPTATSEAPVIRVEP